MGDAIAVCLMEKRGFAMEDFAKFHPGGTLGIKLYLRVADLYIDHEKPEVKTLTTSMVAATGSCGNSLGYANLNPAYRGWISLVDHSGISLPM